MAAEAPGALGRLFMASSWGVAAWKYSCLPQAAKEGAANKTETMKKRNAAERRMGGQPFRTYWTGANLRMRDGIISNNAYGRVRQTAGGPPPRQGQTHSYSR